MSLRNRVLLGFLAITILLVVTDVVIAVSVHRSLIDQVDKRIEGALEHTPPSRLPGFAGTFQPDSGDVIVGPASRPVSGDTASGSSDLTEFSIAFMSTDGTILRNAPAFRDEKASPHLDPNVIASHATAPHQTPRYFTVGADGGGSVSYRMAAVRWSDGYLIVGVSLRETNATFGRLSAVVVASTLAILVALALIAFWVVRLGVRPIDDMAATANAIAEGDLSRRVEVGPDNTEAGRLGLALNGMLHQIEGAFAQRQASEQQLRQFVADASHELRTPLTSIRGYTELYRTGVIASGPELDDAMRRIEGEATRMGDLVDDLLLLARLDQGRPLEEEPVDLGALARDAVADARAVEPRRPIAVETPAEPVVVTGDERRLRQVVGNLLANARSHTPEGTPVDVRVRSGAGLALLEVVDEGPGIDPAVGNRVFERFYRGDPARVRDGAGAGLGLSIVAAVAESHHGRAWVESEPGRGARFAVELPLRERTPSAEVAPAGS
ncbi:MAG TPA: HAMP domain-containing sensor histidine kinase [Acidimicrobiales bacterium]|nr:HAMP domain-containing sensor histidine kinase [Acidimicrobiales bacterium]